MVDFFNLETLDPRHIYSLDCESSLYALNSKAVITIQQNKILVLNSTNMMQLNVISPSQEGVITCVLANVNKHTFFTVCLVHVDV